MFIHLKFTPLIACTKTNDQKKSETYVQTDSMHCAGSGTGRQCALIQAKVKRELHPGSSSTIAIDHRIGHSFIIKLFLKLLCRRKLFSNLQLISRANDTVTSKKTRKRAIKISSQFGPEPCSPRRSRSQARRPSWTGSIRAPAAARPVPWAAGFLRT